MKALPALCACLLMLPAALPRAAAQRAEVVPQTGHLNLVMAVAFSPDGRLIASGGGDHAVKLWDMTTRLEARSLLGHAGVVNCVAFSGDSRLLASGSDDFTIRIWDVSTGVEVRTLGGLSGQAVGVALSPDGRLIAGGSSGGGADQTVRVWEAATGKLLHVVEDSVAEAVAFSPDGRLLATAGLDSTVKLWATDGWRLERSVGSHADIIYHVAFSPDGGRLASGDWQGLVKVWDAATGGHLKTLREGSDRVRYLAFSPGGRRLASLGLKLEVNPLTRNFKVVSSPLKLWDVDAGKELFAVEGHVSQAMAFSPDGRTLASGGDANAVNLLDAATGEPIFMFRSYSSRVASAAFSPDGRLVASGTANLSGAKVDSQIRIWDLSKARAVCSLQGHSDYVSSVAFSPDGKSLASGSQDGTVRFWDIGTCVEKGRLDADATAVFSVAYSPDGRTLLSGGADGLARVWDVQGLKELRVLSGHEALVWAVAVAPGGRICATGSWDNVIKLWDLGTGGELATLVGHDRQIVSLAFSPDARTLASGSLDGTIRLWDVGGGHEFRTLSDELGDAHSVAFSPDGRTLAGTGSGTALALWDVKAGGPPRRLVGHRDRVQSVGFNRDGRLLVSGGLDATVRLWDVAAGAELASMVAVDVADYMIVAPDNYYTSSRGALKKVGFRTEGNSVHPFEQFDVRLNRPDLLLERIGLAAPRLVAAYRAAYERRLRRLNFTESALADDFHVPDLTLPGDLPRTTSERRMRLKVRASDTRFSLDRLHVYVNDVPAYGSNGLSLRGEKVLTVERELAFDLSLGANKVQVSALNDRGTESLKRTFNVTLTGPAAKPDLYVVAVGVSEYRDRDSRLDYAAKDAQDFTAYFRSAGPNFNRVHVLSPITDARASRERILAAKDFLARAGVDDVVVLYLAGHGTLDEGLNYFFGTYDIDFARPAGRGLSYEAIEGLLDGLAARKKLLLMDTCHAGELDEEASSAPRLRPAPARGGRPPSVRPGVLRRGRLGNSHLGLGNSFILMQELFADLRRGSGATVIAAARGSQYAYEGGGNGLFTKSLLEGLCGGADGGDGKVMVGELRDWVAARVASQSRGRQVPTARRENLEFDWVIR